jgi:hypothetical protein
MRCAAMLVRRQEPVCRFRVIHLVQEVATGNTVLTIDLNPRLIIFGFDADQKKGQLKTILSVLKAAGAQPRSTARGTGTARSGRGPNRYRPNLRRQPQHH